MEESTYLGSEIQPDYAPTSDEKTFAILAHILTFIAPLIAPLIIYLIKKMNQSLFPTMLKNL